MGHFIFPGMESTSCDRRVYLNKYVDIKKLLIFDGTIGRIHRQFLNGPSLRKDTQYKSKICYWPIKFHNLMLVSLHAKLL
jgi:hypothetical protein